MKESRQFFQASFARGRGAISVCVRIRRSGSKQAEVHEAEFRSFTQDLERLRDWLKQHKVKQVAMESTGVDWIPVWNILEPVSWGFELLLVNPQTTCFAGL